MATSETCSVCGQEVRYGYWQDRKAYFHREPADHEPIFGRRFTAEEQAEVERQMDLPRTRVVTRTIKGEKVQVEETYTARQAMTAKAKREAEETPDEDAEPEGIMTEVPEPEVRKTAIERDDERCPQGARNLLNAAARAGWEVRRLTYARGPWIGAKGQVLSISDTVVCGVVDGDQRYAVASWRDGKVASAWYGERQDAQVNMNLTTITEIKNTMKGAA